MSTYADFLNLPPGARVKFRRAYQIVEPDEQHALALVVPADVIAIVQDNKLMTGEQFVTVIADSVAVRAACNERMGRENFDVGPVSDSLSEDCPFDAV